MEEKLKRGRVFYRNLKKEFKEEMEADRCVVYKSIDVHVESILTKGALYDEEFFENCGISTKKTGYPNFKFLSEWEAGRVLFLNWLEARKQQ